MSSATSTPRSSAPEPSRWLQIVAEAVNPSNTHWEWLRTMTSRANADFTYRELAVFCATTDPPIDSLAKLQLNTDALEAGMWLDLLTSTVQRLQREIGEPGSSSAVAVPEWTSSVDEQAARATVDPRAGGGAPTSSTELPTPPSVEPAAQPASSAPAESRPLTAASSLSLSDVSPDVLDRVSRGASASDDLVVSMATAESAQDEGSLVYSVDTGREIYGAAASTGSGLREQSCQSSLREVSDWREPSSPSSPSGPAAQPLLSRLHLSSGSVSARPRQEISSDTVEEEEMHSMRSSVGEEVGPEASESGISIQATNSTSRKRIGLTRSATSAISERLLRARQGVMGGPRGSKSGSVQAWQDDEEVGPLTKAKSSPPTLKTQGQGSGSLGQPIRTGERLVSDEL